eukprot:3565120-Rhodomonas_salina.3
MARMHIQLLCSGLRRAYRSERQKGFVAAYDLGAPLPRNREPLRRKLASIRPATMARAPKTL